MDITSLQKQIVSFAEKRCDNANVKIDKEFAHLHLVEELGEVTSELVNRRLRPDLFNEDNLKEEVVDVILQSLILAHYCGVDLVKDIENKINKLHVCHNIPRIK